MRRTLIGILALVLLFLWLVTLVFGPGGSAASGFAGGCLRVGLVLGALWLAWPQILAGVKRLPGWLIGWFLPGAKGRPEGRVSAPAGDKPSPPPARVKRPRRRNNA
jgi:hypothetical protein